MANVRFLFSSRPNFFPNQITVIKLVFLYKLNGFIIPICNGTYPLVKFGKNYTAINLDCDNFFCLCEDPGLG